MPKTRAALAPRSTNKRVQRTLLAAKQRAEKVPDKALAAHIAAILNGTVSVPGGKRA